MWFYADSASGPTNIACRVDNATNANYTAEEQALIPYTCGSGGGTFWIRNVFIVDVGESIDSFNLRSLMGDNNLGDYSLLNRLNVAGR